MRQARRTFKFGADRADDADEEMDFDFIDTGVAVIRANHGEWASLSVRCWREQIVDLALRKPYPEIGHCR